jgi:C_GCAxxG_C_C family probable redox protein
MSEQHPVFGDVSRRDFLRRAGQAAAAVSVVAALGGLDRAPREARASVSTGPTELSHSQTAADLFTRGYGCSESVLMAYGPSLGLERHLCQRLALPLDGGMGCLGKTCGVLTGAMLVLGLHAGATKPDAMSKRMHTMAAVQKLVAEFSKLHTDTDCGDLLGVDIGKPEGLAEFKSKGLFKTHCVRYLHETTRVLDQLLREG